MKINANTILQRLNNYLDCACFFIEKCIVWVWWSCRALGFRLKGPGFETTSAISKLGQFRSPTLTVSFGRDSKSCWSLLSGVCARGSKISHAGKWKKTCDGLTNSRERHFKTRRTTLEISLIWCALICYPRYY